MTTNILQSNTYMDDAKTKQFVDQMLSEKNNGQKKITFTLAFAVIAEKTEWQPKRYLRKFFTVRT